MDWPNCVLHKAQWLALNLIENKDNFKNLREHQVQWMERTVSVNIFVQYAQNCLCLIEKKVLNATLLEHLLQNDGQVDPAQMAVIIPRVLEQTCGLKTRHNSTPILL